jgi:chromosome segregation ATPase
MGSDNELVRLENYIERLLSGYAALKAEKQDVEKRLAAVQEEKAAAQGETTAAQDEIAAVKEELAAAQAQIEKLQGELDSVDSERTVTRDRVSSLIVQIEQWESELEAGPDAESADDDTAAQKERSKREEPAVKQSKEDRGTKAQKNLFSA